MNKEKYKFKKEFQSIAKYWHTYSKDANGNPTHSKRYDGFELWEEFDEKNRKIHLKNSEGFEYWWKYDKKGEIFLISKEEFEEIKIEKEFLSRKKCSRFKLMEL